MYHFKSYVEILLLVSIFHIAAPQIKNLSPLRGILNTNLPDSFRTTTECGIANNAPTPQRTIIISVDDVEDAMEDGFASMSRNRYRPQGKVPPAAASFPQGGGAADGALAGGGSFDNDEEQEIDDEEQEIDDEEQEIDDEEQEIDDEEQEIDDEEQEIDDEEQEIEAASLSHFRFRQTEPASEQASNCIGQPLEMASMLLMSRNKLTPGEAMMNLPNIVLEEDSCIIQQRRLNYSNIISLNVDPLCNPDAGYRTLNGSCNNLRNREWGSSKRRFNRYLQPAYEDGIHKMRGEGRTIPLPSARTVSVRLQDRLENSQKPPSKNLTLLVMQWGKFLDHDLTHTPSSTSDAMNDYPSPMACCEGGKRDPTFPSDEPCRDSCCPIDTSNDKYYKKHDRKCMRFVRSLVASKGCSTGCLGPREQLNQLTSYLDASNVYGSDDVKAVGLRKDFGGLLRESDPPSGRHGGTFRGTFLPKTNCLKADFEAGETRVNEQPALTSMHTLWLRVHNNIARDLASLNASWDDERLYQETRRIVAALHQQITYREFLPVVHGPDSLREFNLNLKDQGYDNSYNDSVDATIVNVFATAAFRYGHTLIAESFKGMGRNVTLRGNFDNPSVLNDPSTSPSAILKGLTACPTRGADGYLTDTLVNHLFSKKNATFGYDLMAFNIQRGRDHGLPPYHEWRRSCNLSSINSFEDLESIMDPEAAEVFEQSYQCVKDIDLFPAALAEKLMPGGLLGPTFSCLLAQQFQDIKIGDRFWYENGNQPNPFTTDQLSALREQSLASIMCHHLRLDSLQPMVFKNERLEGNKLQDCSAFPRLNLRSWSQRLCYGVGVWQQVPGMDQWCTDNCLDSGAQYCPTSQCRCNS